MAPLSPSAEEALRRCLTEGEVYTDELTRIAFAPDASLYWYVPAAVVFPRDIGDIQRLFAWSRREKIPLTFRAAGTSLSGQAVTDGILVEVRRYWQRWEIRDTGVRVRAQPGVRAGLLNEQLRPYWRRLGPDPASVNVCTLGGIVANNASGMCCGTRDTAYRTLESLVVVLPDGTVLNTGAPDADTFLWHHAPTIAEGLLRIRQHIMSTPSLRERIERKYRLKNTVGYSLNAFIDFDSPAQILAHLMVGSEGTLGFLAEIELRTVPDPPLRLTGLAIFGSPEEACRAVPALRDLGADAVELLDSAALRSTAGHPGIPAETAHLPDSATALLFEYQRFAWNELQEAQQETLRLLHRSQLLLPLLLTSEAEHQHQLWNARRSLYPLVAARRPVGSTPISEDIAVPVEALPDTLRQLRALFLRHGYQDAVIFGHAKDGNLHFVLPQPLQSPQDEERYAALMDELVTVVLSHDGSLKAEHGTGRNMAPFVRAEWGEEAYELMWHIKRLIDPDGILNPDVILSHRERLHVLRLKRLPLLSSEADRCMECGFCEPVCPSRTLTLTPRQRIAVLRYLPAAVQSLQWRYAVADTCAADGLCHLRCPVGINTGNLVLALRQHRRSALSRRLAQALSLRFRIVDTTVRASLRSAYVLASLLGAERMRRLTGQLNRYTRRAFPAWHLARVTPPRLRFPSSVPQGSTVLFPSCAARWLNSGAEALLQLAQRAGIELHLFPHAQRFCCGLFFASKGFPEAATQALGKLREVLRHCAPSRLVVEGSSCALWLKEQMASEGIPVEDTPEFLSQILPHLPVHRRVPQVALHIPCAAQRMGIAAHLVHLATACAESVLPTPDGECCGAAGDRWLFVPELARSAAARLVASLPKGTSLEGYSSNPPCAAALESVSPYRWHPLPRLLLWATASEATQSPME